jgi:hypothetical protein
MASGVELAAVVGIPIELNAVPLDGEHIVTLTSRMCGSPRLSGRTGEKCVRMCCAHQIWLPWTPLWASRKPLTWAFSRAEDGIRTRDPHLGNSITQRALPGKIWVIARSLARPSGSTSYYQILRAGTYVA